MSDNYFLIAQKQLRQSELSGYFIGLLNGAFTGLLQNYNISNGYFGPNVVYATGMDQLISGQKTFTLSPNIPYTGTSGQSPSKLYVDTGDAFLQNQLNVLTNIVYISGDQLISGLKRFYTITINSGAVTGSFTVPSPTNSGDAVPLQYVTDQVSILNTGSFVHITGDETIDGIKRFINTGTIYTSSGNHESGVINLSQLTTTGQSIISRVISSGASLQSQINTINNSINNIDLTAAADVTGFGGVLSLNAQSGNIFTQGRGTVSATQVGNILNISGHTLNGYTGAFLGSKAIISGVDRQFIAYDNNYSVIPYVFAQIENNSGNPHITCDISGRDTNGFYALYSNIISGSGYNLTYIGWTGSGSVVNTIQGPQGLSGTAGVSISTNYVLMNYFAREIVTGLNIYEQFNYQNLDITEYSIGVSQVGISNGLGISGRIYARDVYNNKTVIKNFELFDTLESDYALSISPAYAIYPYDRIGIDISGKSTLSSGLCITIYAVAP